MLDKINLTQHWINSRQSERILVNVYEPQGDLSGVALIHHGYGGSSQSPVITRLREVFLSAGMSTVVPDTRNSLNQSGGDITHFTFQEHAENLEDVYNWLVTEGDKHIPFHLCGYSLGGYSVTTLLKLKENFRSALLVAPIFSGIFFRQGMEASAPGIMDFWKDKESIGFKNDTGIDFNAPYRCWDEWLRADSIGERIPMSGKVTLVTAQKDSLILDEHLEVAEKAFSLANLKLVTIPEETHFFDQHPNRLKNLAKNHLG
ncbi:MAG: alpha/beta hydrolase [Alphaproteobacteria bacterium]|nr:alpha/beta hydrolase [Alphaproteobacteria bacterium]